VPIAKNPPIVSVLMANFNGAEHVAAALKSVLAQSLSNIEILFADDASTDDSVAIATAIMGQDARVKILTTKINAGPGAARNRALDVATGTWVAIVDSDDLIHPRRFERLIELADELHTDGIADDMTCFGSDQQDGAATLFGELSQARPINVTANVLLASELELAGRTPFGYLKPLLQREGLKNLRYREDLRLGEDHDFYARYLLQGGQLHLVAQSYYLYRRHQQSFSHRLSVADVENMIRVQNDLLAQFPDMVPELRKLFDERDRTLHKTLQFERLVADLKKPAYAAALGAMLRYPGLLSRIGRSAYEHFTKPKDSAQAIRTAEVDLISAAHAKDCDGYLDRANDRLSNSLNAGYVAPADANLNSHNAHAGSP